MSNISTWSKTAASNNSTPPDGFPEGQTPGSVNNSARELMAAVRTQHEDAQWIDFGHTVAYASASTFTIATDLTAIYDVNRRVKLTDSSTLYGTITASSYSNPNTTVTVSLDSGSISGSLTAAAVGIISGSSGGAAIVTLFSDITVTNDATINGDIIVSGVVDGRDVAADGAILDAVGVQSVKLNTKVIDIGDWDMDSDVTKAVAHGLTLANIRTAHVMIRSDDGASFSPLNHVGTIGDGETEGSIANINATTVSMARLLGGGFDTPLYNSTSYNRGWITIQYTD